MKNQAILFILSIDGFYPSLPPPVAAVHPSRSSPAMGRHTRLDVLIREIT